MNNILQTLTYRWFRFGDKTTTEITCMNRSNSSISVNTGYIMTVPDHSDYIYKHLKFATVTVLFSIQHQFTNKFQLNIFINSRIRCVFFPNHELFISLLPVQTQNLTIHTLTDRHFLVYQYEGTFQFLHIISWTSGTPPSHYLNQCWYIVNLNLTNKLQWKFN